MKKIWYSGATDITGRALAEALNIEGVRARPVNLRDDDITICWGVKTDSDVQMRGHVLNHPNAIRKNRNKLAALKIMYDNRDLTNSIAPFVAANDITNTLRASRMSFPIIGRKSHHQGGKGFWLCLNKGHISAAVSAGADYFQKYIDIATEYRLHVFDGKIIYAVKKVENDTEAGWVTYRKDKARDYADKNNIQLDNNTVDHVLKVLYKEQQLPNRIVRSNHQGWKFSNVAINNVPAALKNVAIKAVEALGLDFAAVDCAVDESENPWIIECNSGPGLQGTTFEKYTEAFRNKIAELERPAVRQEEDAEVRPRQRAAAVGAQNNEAPGAGGGLLRIMQNVHNDNEARAVIEALMRQAL